MLGLITLYALLIIIFIFHEPFAKLITPLFMERDAFEVLKESDIDYYHKRVQKAIIPFLALFVWPFLNYDFRFLGIISLCSFYLYKKSYWKQKKWQRNCIQQLQFQFPIWLRQLQILIQTNTVQQALVASSYTAPSLIQDDLQKLIQQINEDALSIKPYLNFLSQYHIAEVERAMKLLYRYHSVGKADAYQQLQRMIETTAKWIRAQRRNRVDVKMLFYQWWGMLPLLGVTIMFMAVMFQIMVDLFGKGVA